MTVKISSIRGRQILDSRGRPTVEAEVLLSDGRTALASVPSGASTGRHEAVERRDGDPAHWRGMGVLGAADSISTEISARLAGVALDSALVDRALIDLDGTADKSRLGANAILATSLAIVRAESMVAGVPLWQHLSGGRDVTLPLPMVNIISGGLHAGRQLDFQDFLVIPVGADSYRQALEWVGDVHAATADVLAESGYSLLKADEGGFGPALSSHEEALEILDRAVERAGLRLGDDIAYAHRRCRVALLRPGARFLLARRGAARLAGGRGDRSARGHGATGIRSCPSRTGWPRTTGRTGRTCSIVWATASRSSETTSSPPTPTACDAGIERAPRTPFW